eukprot:491894_1
MSLLTLANTQVLLILVLLVEYVFVWNLVYENEHFPIAVYVMYSYGIISQISNDAVNNDANKDRKFVRYSIIWQFILLLIQAVLFGFIVHTSIGWILFMSIVLLQMSLHYVLIKLNLKTLYLSVNEHENDTFYNMENTEVENQVDNEENENNDCCECYNQCGSCCESFCGFLLDMLTALLFIFSIIIKYSSIVLVGFITIPYLYFSPDSYFGSIWFEGLTIFTLFVNNIIVFHDHNNTRRLFVESIIKCIWIIIQSLITYVLCIIYVSQTNKQFEEAWCIICIVGNSILICIGLCVFMT